MNNHKNIAIANASFSQNASGRHGGAIEIGTNAELTLSGDESGTSFEGNSAVNGGALYFEGGSKSVTFEDAVTFTGNTATEKGGAIYSCGMINMASTVTLATETDTIYNAEKGTLNWDLADGKAGCLNGYDKLENDGALQITMDDAIVAPANIVIATGNFSNIDDKKTFVITNSVLGGEALQAEIDGEAVIANFTLYQLTTEEDLDAEPPTTNLVFTVIKPDMTKVAVNSNWEGKYKLGEEIEIEGETYYYGLTALVEVPAVPNALSTTEELIIAGGSASITNEITLKRDESGNPIGKLVVENGAALSIMGEGSITNSLAATDSISGNGAIYLDKGLTDDQLKNYTDKLADGSTLTIARASVTDGMAKTTVTESFYDVNAHEMSKSGEKTDTVITSDLTADGIDAEKGLALRVTDAENLVAAGSLTATAGAAKPQTLKLVREEAATGDLTVNGKVSGFETITVENKNATGKMTTTSTLAANKDILISNDGHLEAKAQAGGNIDINNTSANTIIGEYSGQKLYVTNTAEGVAQDITLQAYGADAVTGNITLYGKDGCVYSNVVLVSGVNATPADLSANDCTGKVIVYGTNTFSGTVLVKGEYLMERGTWGTPLLRFENADAILSVNSIVPDTEIYGVCNIASNDNGMATFSNSLTLKDGAVLGGNTRIASSCDNDYFILEGTVTLKDGAEVSRGDDKVFTVPDGATLKLQGSKIRGQQLAISGTLDVEDGLNDVNKIGSAGTINLKGGELIVDESLTNSGVLNWNLTAGTTTLDWAKVSGSGAWMATVTNVASGTSYTLARNAATVTKTFTVTNSVAGGAAATVKAGGVCKVAGQFWALDVKNGQLTLTALAPVKLTDVFLVDAEGKTNATAVVKAGGNTFEPEADGSFEVPANYPLDIVYEAANYGEEDGNMFGPGLKNKTVSLPGISGDTSLDDAYPELKAQAASQCQAQWVDGDGEAGGREMMLDTRERIVVASPNDVLPIAYSTNYWGTVDGGSKVSVLAIDPNGNITDVVEESAESGYGEYMPKLGDYGQYEFQQSWFDSTGEYIARTNATVWYGQDYQFVFDEDQMIYVERPGDEHGLGNLEDITSYTILNLKATPEYTNVDRYEFVTWKAYSYGERDIGWKTPEECPQLAACFGDIYAAETTFEMPFTNVFLTCSYQWKSNYNEVVSVEPGIYNAWEIHEGEWYKAGIATTNGSIVSFREDIGTCFYGSGESALNLAAGATNIWDFTKNGRPCLEFFTRIAAEEGAVNMVLFDETLTNASYRIAAKAQSAVGTAFLISDGSSAQECTVVAQAALETTDWTYVGEKRFKLYVMTNNILMLLVKPGIPMALVYAASPVEGGTIAASTNGAAVTSGTKVLPDMTVTIVATTNLHWQFNGWSGTDATGSELTFVDPMSATTTFKMPETNATVTAAFGIAGTYRAELRKALDGKYAATTNAIEALRLNRLTDDEADKALSIAKSDYDTAARDIAAATTPKDGETAKSTADSALSTLLKNAGEESDAKPYDLIVADDFEAIADAGSYDPETGTFTVDGVAYEIGVNAFTSFRAAYAETTDVPFTTNVHVYGAQLIEDDVPNLYPWTLDLHDAVLSIGIDDQKSLYASITNALDAIKGGDGILFGKTEDDETRAVQAVLEDKLPEGSEIVIKPADVTPEKKTDPSTGEEVIEAKVDETAKSEDGVTTLPQMVSDDGNVNVIVEATVTNDTVVAGKVAATNGTVTIVHEAEQQSLEISGSVVAKNVVIDNYGHFDADVAATVGLVITNRSVNTLVGDYSGANISLEGIDYASISGATFTATEKIILTGKHGIYGHAAFTAPTVDNRSCLAWSVKGMNHETYLEDFAAVTNGDDFAVMADKDQDLGDNLPVAYTLAGNAAAADGRTFKLVQDFGGSYPQHWDVVVGGGKVYPGDSRSYRIDVNTNNELVLTVDWGGVRFTASEVTGVIGGDPIAVEVDGGMPDRPTQVTVSLQKNTLSSFRATMLVGGVEKKVSFPLTLNWDAGVRETKVISIIPGNGGGCAAGDRKFLTFELGSEVGQLLVAPQVCTVTVNPKTADDTLYVRALPWPANGGKVSGSGVIKTDGNGNVKTARMLKAKANKWATFAGWYAAKADDANQIDLSNKITDEKNLKVGKGTEYVEGTFYAYFTDVLAVPAINLPDASAEGAAGVSVDEATGSYEGTVGVKFSLPITYEDDSGNGKIGVSQLPAGLRYNKTTGCIEGVPTKAGVKTVKVVAKNMAGKHTATFDFVIEALPANASGTWYGLVRELEDLEDGTHAGFGTVQFTAGKTGSLSAKVMTRLTGARSFSVKGYDRIDENVFGIEMAAKKGEIFKATLVLTNDWKTAQLAGTVTGGAFAGNDEEVKFAAIRNAFTKKDPDGEAALGFLQGYKGDYEAELTETNGTGLAVGSLVFRVKDGGNVYLKAKTAEKTYAATCAGAFRALPDMSEYWSAGSAAVQAAMRSGKRLWATDTVIGPDCRIDGLSCEYDAEGEDTHARVIGMDD